MSNKLRYACSVVLLLALSGCYAGASTGWGYAERDYTYRPPVVYAYPGYALPPASVYAAPPVYAYRRPYYEIHGGGRRAWRPEHAWGRGAASYELRHSQGRAHGHWHRG